MADQKRRGGMGSLFSRIAAEGRREHEAKEAARKAAEEADAQRDAAQAAAQKARIDARVNALARAATAAAHQERKASPAVEPPADAGEAGLLDDILDVTQARAEAAVDGDANPPRPPAAPEEPKIRSSFSFDVNVGKKS